MLLIVRTKIAGLFLLGRFFAGQNLLSNAGLGSLSEQIHTNKR